MLPGRGRMLAHCLARPFMLDDTTAYVTYEDLSVLVTALVAGAILAAYVMGLLRRTHRFSYRRLCFALCAGAILFCPVACFVAAGPGVYESFRIHYPWCRVVAISLMFGSICMSFGLMLGCDTHRGAISNLAARVLKCQPRGQNDEPPRKGIWHRLELALRARSSHAARARNPISEGHLPCDGPREP